jgi:DNA-binding GntR family transcriptional regulator
MGKTTSKASKLVPTKAAPATSRKNLKRQTTVELVADELRKRIISGELTEGEQLLQEHLASDLGVSRIPVREALRQLEAEGLVTLSSHRGGVVSKLSLDEIKELFETRSCLETWLLSLAIPLMTAADFDAVEAVVKQMLPGEITHWGELNWRFHEALYAPARRELTMLMLRRIHHNVDRYLRLQITLTSGWQKAHLEHRSIVDFCRAKDIRRATAALDNHIMNAANELIETISKRRAKSGKRT